MINVIKELLLSWLLSRLEKEIQKLELKLDEKRAKLLSKMKQNSDEHEEY